MGLTETGDTNRARVLSYANTLYKDCLGFYTHSMVKGPRILPMYAAFMEFGVEMTDLVLRVFTREEKNESEAKGESDRHAQQKEVLNESKGKGSASSDHDKSESESEEVEVADDKIAREEQAKAKEWRVRTLTTLLGANLRFAQGIAQPNSSSALFAQGQQMVPVPTHARTHARTHRAHTGL